MELTLEIAEGSKYNNLINEIERQFNEFNDKAYESFYQRDYEKCIQYYHKCLIIDADNPQVKYIERKLKEVLNNYFKKIHECAYCSYDNGEFELSKYYFTKCYCLICGNELYIHDKNFKYLKIIENMVKKINDIQEINENNVIDITYDSFYKIKLKNK